MSIVGKKEKKKSYTNKLKTENGLELGSIKLQTDKKEP